MKKISRNHPCPCGSGRKYKHCCLLRDDSGAPSRRYDSAQAAPLIRIAREHHQAGRLGEAEAGYRQILAAEPNHPEALHLLGVMGLQAGRPEMAVELISQAIRADSADPVYHCNLGLAYKALGRSDDAVASFRKALAIKPDDADAWSELGIAFIAKGNSQEAEASFRKALAVRPDHAVAHSNLGNALALQGQVEEAIACYGEAIAIAPDYAEAHYNLGGAFTEHGRHEEAIAAYRDALAIAPDYAGAHYHLGNALRKLGRSDEAAASLRAVLKLDPDFAQAHNDLGIALYDMGELDEAIASTRRALALKPDLYEAHFNLHALLLNPDDLGPSIECLEKAVELKPDDSEFRFALGMILDYTGDSGAAAHHFGRIAKDSALHQEKLDAWRYIKSAGKELPRMMGSMIDTFRLGLAAAGNEGLVLEFGVRFGTSIRQIAALANQDVHGFDSFEGLPEAWHDEPRGVYTTRGVIPSVPGNVILHPGWFENTLPAFVAEYTAPVRFMNIDCDIYSSTRTVLEFLADRIVPGTVIVFDEYIGNDHWREDEFRAFQEAVEANGWKYEYLCFSFFTKQAVVRII